ncbi:hypothetical protein BOX15_Mlig021265g2, partial [Macrostomum lignano]
DKRKMPGSKKPRSVRLLTDLAEQLDRQFEGETALQELADFLQSREIRAAVAAHETLRRMEKQKRKLGRGIEKSAFPEAAGTDFIQALRSALDTLEPAAAGSNDDACELYDLLASARMNIFVDALEDIGHRNYKGEPPLGRVSSHDLVECNVDESEQMAGGNHSLLRGAGALSASLGGGSELIGQPPDGQDWRGSREDDLDEFGRPQKMIAFSKAPGEDLGITVGTIEWYDENTGQSGLDIVVERIMAGSRIDQQNTLKPYDVIREVNGIPIDSPEKLQQVMRKASGNITLKVRSGFYESSKPVQEAFTYVKALFSYDPQYDGLLPCREAGLKFTVGDVLQVLSQEDPNWWQARLWSSQGRAGLIPSLTLQERRVAFVQSAPDKDAINYKVMGLGLTSKKRKVKMTYKAKLSQTYEKSDLTIYQEVARVPPFKRSLVLLLGAPGIGKYSLIDQLIRQRPEEFARPIPHTSRPQRDGELNGEKYLFAGQSEMEVDIRRGGYLEHGQLNGHLYGIKMDTLRSMAKQDRTLILDCAPEKARLVCTAEFKPYVVFLAAPSFECMKSMYELGSSLGLTRKLKRDEDFRRSIQESIRIERSYRHLFDAVLICDNFDACCEQLETLLDSLSREHQWLPVSWLY